MVIFYSQLKLFTLDKNKSSHTFFNMKLNTVEVIHFSGLPVRWLHTVYGVDISSTVGAVDRNDDLLMFVGSDGLFTGEMLFLGRRAFGLSIGPALDRVNGESDDIPLGWLVGY